MGSALGRWFGHLAGVATIAGLIALLTLEDLVADVALASVQPQLASHGLSGFAVHTFVAALVWACVYLIASRLLRRSPRSERTVKLSRGTTMVETLIVFPFMLLLISGLSQLAIMNSASLLSNLAGYNAGRAVWVWDAQGVSDAECEKRAIDGAAHAVAPSVPDDFVGASGNRSGDAGSLMFAAAYDRSGDIEGRADGKLRFARESIDVEVIRGPRAGARMTYRFHIAFPWFAYMFGQPDTVGERTGYFLPIRRDYTLPRQP